MSLTFASSMNGVTFNVSSRKDVGSFEFTVSSELAFSSSRILCPLVSLAKESTTKLGSAYVFGSTVDIGFMKASSDDNKLMSVLITFLPQL